MSITDDVNAGMGNAFTGFAVAGLVAYNVSRTRSAERRADQFELNAADARGRVNVLRDKTADLRERAIDAEDEASFLRAENARLCADVRRLEAALRKLSAGVSKRAA
jgi:hypothetical protein